MYIDLQESFFMNADLNTNVETSLNETTRHQEAIPINRDSPVPLHHQVRNYLLDCIERGELLPGQKLLQEREYAARFGLSLAPVRQAILDLVKEGYLYRVPGRGTFVREQKVEEKISILSSFSESMRAKGLSAVLNVAELRISKIPPNIRAALAAEDQQCIFLQRVALIESKAIALLTSYLPARLVPGLETLDFNGRSLYKTLEERYGISLLSSRKPLA